MARVARRSVSFRALDLAALELASGTLQKQFASSFLTLISLAQKSVSACVHVVRIWCVMGSSSNLRYTALLLLLVLCLQM